MVDPLAETIRTHLRDRLADSHLKNLIADELATLCAEKPTSISIDTFAGHVAQAILVELHSQLRHLCEIRGRVELRPEDHTAPVDFESVLSGLLTGMEHDLVIGNLQMLQALGDAVAIRDTGTSDHNLRVTLYAQELGEAVGLDRDSRKALMKGSFLHDVGKIGIRDEILLKTGKLTPEERDTMHSHVLYGCRIIDGVKWLEDAHDVVRHHHERFDGDGYPDHLAGDEVPLNARIFAVADVFDALISERPYKPALSKEETLQKMGDERGTHFDPHLFDVFCGISEDIYQNITSRPTSAVRQSVAAREAALFDVTK